MTFGHNAAMEDAAAGNWIAVSREIRDHPIVGFGQPVKPANPKRGSYSRTEAWLDLIMEARFQAGQINNKGKIVMLARGQLMAARAWLADRWNWTENAVRWFLDKLEKEVMITRNHHHSKPTDRRHYVNVLTIEKYNIFQAASEILDLMDAAQTTNQPPINHQSTTNQPPESNKGTREQDKSPDGDSSPDQLLLMPDDAPKLTASIAAREAFRLYNETAARCELPLARTLSPARMRALALRVKEAGGLDGFKQAMANLEKSAWLQGKNDRGWSADLDFVCQAKSFTKLFEGGYGNGAHAVSSSSYAKNGAYAGASL